MNVGHKIRRYREEKNYIQEYMSEELNISQNTYSKIETGGIKLTIDRLKQISDILDVPIEDILNTAKSSLSVNNCTTDKDYHSESLHKDNKELLDKTVNMLNQQMEYLRTENQKLINIIDKLTNKTK